jgi:DNA-binding transcriptional MerR regulator
MLSTKFHLTPQLEEFINNYRLYSFRDRNALIQAALLRLQQELELQNLKHSANLYAEVYEEDDELQTLTQATVDGWPE